jgi:hypothetical protein
MKFLLTLLLVPQLALSSPELEDAFAAYVKVRQWEERIAALPLRTDLLDNERAAQKAEMTEKLAAARREFQEFKNAEMEPWGLEALANLQTGKKHEVSPKEALPFLESSFPEAKTLSFLEWEAIGDFFGRANQRAFLAKVFPPQTFAEKNVAERKVPIVWVMDPFRKMLSAEAKKPSAPWEKAAQKVEISAFGTVEEQAEELYVRLHREESFVLISSGNASAVVYKMLDLYPALRSSKFILGWINVNGNLFGKAMTEEKKPGRGPASVKPASPVEKWEKNALRGLYLQHLEGIERSPSLGDGFPIFNVVPKGSSREALVAEGSTYPADAPWDYIQPAISLLAPAPPADEQ